MLHTDNEQPQQAHGLKEGVMIGDHVIEMDLEDYSVAEEV